MWYFHFQYNVNFGLILTSNRSVTIIKLPIGYLFYWMQLLKREKPDEKEEEKETGDDGFYNIGYWNRRTYY